MHIHEFKECNILFAKDQIEYLKLPAHKTEEGIVTSCWVFSFTERIKLLFTGRVYVRMLTFNKPLQPLVVTVHKPDMEEELDANSK